MVPAPPPEPQRDWRKLQTLMMEPLPPLSVGIITEMRATEDYFGVYFCARHDGSRDYFSHCHISLMHSALRRLLSEDQLSRLLRRAQAELVWMPVATCERMVYVWNDDGTLRRTFQKIPDSSKLAEKMWHLRNMVCNWLGPRYGERRRDFHISFDRVM